MTIDQILNWDRETALVAAPRLVGLRPNWITSISLVLAVLGLALIGLGPRHDHALAGAGLIFASRWVDWIDGWVARKTNTASDLGGLYDIAVGYLTMVTVMVVIGYRQNDLWLAYIGAGAAILLRLVLMVFGWALSRRQRLDVIQWNPQKILTPRQPPLMRSFKWALDLARNDYWIVLFALIGGVGLRLWGWAYTGAVIALTIWVVIASSIFLSRVHPGGPKRYRLGKDI